MCAAVCIDASWGEVILGGKLVMIVATTIGWRESSKDG